LRLVLATLVLLAGIDPARLSQSPVVYRARDPGVISPVAVDQWPSTYTADAMLAGVEGSLKLECVVNADGTVGPIRIVQPLFPSLDEAAVENLKRWRFRPGTKDGQSVAVLIEIENAFGLGGKRRGVGRIYIPGEHGVTAPRVHREVKAVYPQSLGTPPTAGSVAVEVVVRPDGTVASPKVTKGVAPALAPAALEAVRQWRFSPAWKDGKPVSTRVTVEVPFAMPN
jgi:TonB family protein